MNNNPPIFLETNGLYRNTTIGISLQEALDELVGSQVFSPQIALKILHKFDEVVNKSLDNKIKNRMSFRGNLCTYRFCDNVWTFVLTDTEIKDGQTSFNIDKLKIVACDAKANRSDNTLTSKVKKHYDIKKPVIENSNNNVDEDDSDSADEPDCKRQRPSSTVFHNTPANNL